MTMNTERLEPGWHISILTMLGGGAVGLAIAVAVAETVGYVVVFGGYDCDTAAEIHGCFGYPPTGLLIALMIGVGAVGLVLGQLTADAH